ncbi:MAG: FAD binding domain-containing protein [Pleomorphochaeta sp.]
MYYKNQKLIIPETINELHQEILKNSDNILFAGGTHLMQNKQLYPSSSSQVIISLEKIKELFEVTRNIKYVEVGAMVTTNKLLEIGNLAFNDLLLDTLSNTATHIIRNQITIGGALCTKDIRYSLAGTLACMDSSIELLSLSKNKIISKIIPIEKMYKNNNILIEKNSLVKKIRIPLNHFDFERFYCIDSPIKNPEKSVILAFGANINQTIINNVKMSFTFPKSGIYFTSFISSELEGAQIPIIPKTVNSISNKLVSEIDKNIEGGTPLQKERAKRILQSTLYQITPSKNLFDKNDK